MPTFASLGTVWHVLGWSKASGVKEPLIDSRYTTSGSNYLLGKKSETEGA